MKMELEKPSVRVPESWLESQKSGWLRMDLENINPFSWVCSGTACLMSLVQIN